VRRQSYSNIELVVINDGGADVSDLLEGHANEKYIYNPLSVGIESLLSQCLSAASGKYLCALADDDVFFPDYVESLVYALERTGGAMARSMTATRMLDKRDGEYIILGYAVYTPPAIDSTVMQYQNINGASPLYRTEMLRLDAVPRTHAGHLLDHESYIRYMECFDFICVRAVGACIDVRRDGTNYSAPSPGPSGRTRLAADYVALYSAYPRPDRPELESIRTKMVEHVLRYAAPPMPAVALSGTVAADYKSL
jgi:glycosyltransferase involved in cell wall biosynthesis